MVRKVVYPDLSDLGRRLMHRRVPEALASRVEEAADLIGELMRHATLAQDHGLAAKACVSGAHRCHASLPIPRHDDGHGAALSKPAGREGGAAY